MCFGFSLRSLPFTASLCTFSPLHLSLPLTLAHKQRSLALFMLMGLFRPHESIPFRCIWGYGCHWLPAVRERQPLPALCVCVCVCVHVCVCGGAGDGGVAACPSAALSTEQPLMEPALWTRTHQRRQWRVTKTVRGAVWSLDPLQRGRTTPSDK